MKQVIRIPECNCKIFDAHFCFQHENRKLVTFEDKKGSKSGYEYINRDKNHLAKYRVDNGLITADAGKKCDYLLLNCEKKQSYFIELKGADIFYAIEQIDSSINFLKDKLSDFTVFARIVVTRVNTPHFKSDSRYLKLEMKVESMKGDLKINSVRLKEIA